MEPTPGNTPGNEPGDEPGFATGRPSPAEVDAYYHHVKAIIERHGWFVQGVLDPGGAARPWLYTVGLTEAGLPELAMADVPPEPEALAAAQAIIDHLARLSLTQGVAAGEVYPAGLAEGMYVRTRAGDLPHGRPLATANMVYGQGNVTWLLVEPLYPDPGSN